MKTVNWTQLTRRTNPNKLTWLVRALERVGIPCRLNGETFHAPVLEVDKSQFDRAWEVLGPVDELADDDPMFDHVSGKRAWWIDPPRPGRVGELAAAIGLLANKVRRSIAQGAQCVPEGVDPFACPRWAGLVESCPANLRSVCRPMIRLELLLLEVGKQLRVEDERAIARCEELIQELRGQAGSREQSDYMIAFCHVLSLRMSEGRLGRLVKLSKRETREVVRDVMRETVEVDGTMLPKRFEVLADDVIALDAEDWELN